MRNCMKFFLNGVVIWLILSTQALAVNPNEVLSDPGLEARARALSSEIRCLVCQNQSIDDSDAQLAKDLRVLVREKLVEGNSDQQVLDFLVARYGEFVLLKPRFGWHTLLLWVLPLIALIAGLWILQKLFRKSVQEDSGITSLTDEEKIQLSKILEKQ